MDDAIKATIGIMTCPADKIKTRLGYNIAALSFTVEELVQEIESSSGTRMQVE